MENEKLIKILEEHEKTLSWNRGGDIEERFSHVLGQYRQITDQAIFNCKNFLDDVKTQFKALEIITEGITGQDLNHGQKRVIANHLITTLRRMVDKIDEADHTFSVNMFDRFNFFRSNTPETRLHEAHNQLKYKVEKMDRIFNVLKEKHPDIVKDIENDGLPF